MQTCEQTGNSDAMTDAPWTGDAVSLVDAFRRGERTPLEELDATLAAIEASDINAFSYRRPRGGTRRRPRAPTSPSRSVAFRSA